MFAIKKTICLNTGKKQSRPIQNDYLEKLNPHERDSVWI